MRQNEKSNECLFFFPKVARSQREREREREREQKKNKRNIPCLAVSSEGSDERKRLE
jgi:hypothetical protein